MYWECAARGTSRDRCPAMIVQRNNDFVHSRNPHSHAPVVGLHATIEIEAVIRATAPQDMFAPASALVSGAMAQVDVIDCPHDDRPNTATLVGVTIQVVGYYCSLTEVFFAMQQYFVRCDNMSMAL